MYACVIELNSCWVAAQTGLRFNEEQEQACKALYLLLEITEEGQNHPITH